MTDWSEKMAGDKKLWIRLIALVVAEVFLFTTFDLPWENQTVYAAPTEKLAPPSILQDKKRTPVVDKAAELAGAKRTPAIITLTLPEDIQAVVEVKEGEVTPLTADDIKTKTSEAAINGVLLKIGEKGIPILILGLENILSIEKISQQALDLVGLGPNEVAQLIAKLIKQPPIQELEIPAPKPVTLEAVAPEIGKPFFKLTPVRAGTKDMDADENEIKFISQEAEIIDLSIDSMPIKPRAPTGNVLGLSAKVLQARVLINFPLKEQIQLVRTDDTPSGPTTQPMTPTVHRATETDQMRAAALAESAQGNLKMLQVSANTFNLTLDAPSTTDLSIPTEARITIASGGIQQEAPITQVEEPEGERGLALVSSFSVAAEPYEITVPPPLSPTLALPEEANPQVVETVASTLPSQPTVSTISATRTTTDIPALSKIITITPPTFEEYSTSLTTTATPISTESKDEITLLPLPVQPDVTALSSEVVQTEGAPAMPFDVTTSSHLVGGTTIPPDFSETITTSAPIAEFVTASGTTTQSYTAPESRLSEGHPEITVQPAGVVTVAIEPSLKVEQISTVQTVKYRNVKDLLKRIEVRSLPVYLAIVISWIGLIINMLNGNLEFNPYPIGYAFMMTILAFLAIKSNTNFFSATFMSPPWEEYVFRFGIFELIFLNLLQAPIIGIVVGIGWDWVSHLLNPPKGPAPKGYYNPIGLVLANNLYTLLALIIYYVAYIKIRDMAGLSILTSLHIIHNGIIYIVESSLQHRIAFNKHLPGERGQSWVGLAIVLAVFVALFMVVGPAHLVNPIKELAGKTAAFATLATAAIFSLWQVWIGLYIGVLVLGRFLYWLYLWIHNKVLPVPAFDSYRGKPSPTRLDHGILPFIIPTRLDLAIGVMLLVILGGWIAISLNLGNFNWAWDSLSSILHYSATLDTGPLKTTGLGSGNIFMGISGLLVLLILGQGKDLLKVIKETISKVKIYLVPHLASGMGGIRQMLSRAIVWLRKRAGDYLTEVSRWVSLLPKVVSNLSNRERWLSLITLISVYIFSRITANSFSLPDSLNFLDFAFFSFIAGVILILRTNLVKRILSEGLTTPFLKSPVSRPRKDGKPTRHIDYKGIVASRALVGVMVAIAIGGWIIAGPHIAVISALVGIWVWIPLFFKERGRKGKELTVEEELNSPNLFIRAHGLLHELLNIPDQSKLSHFEDPIIHLILDAFLWPVSVSAAGVHILIEKLQLYFPTFKEKKVKPSLPLIIAILALVSIAASPVSNENSTGSFIQLALSNPLILITMVALTILVAHWVLSLRPKEVRELEVGGTALGFLINTAFYWIIIMMILWPLLIYSKAPVLAVTTQIMLGSLIGGQLAIRIDRQLRKKEIDYWEIPGTPFVMNLPDASYILGEIAVNFLIGWNLGLIFNLEPLLGSIVLVGLKPIFVTILRNAHFLSDEGTADYYPGATIGELQERYNKANIISGIFAKLYYLLFIPAVIVLLHTLMTGIQSEFPSGLVDIFATLGNILGFGSVFMVGALINSDILVRIKRLFFTLRKAIIPLPSVDISEHKALNAKIIAIDFGGTLIPTDNTDVIALDDFLIKCLSAMELLLASDDKLNIYVISGGKIKKRMEQILELYPSFHMLRGKRLHINEQVDDKGKRMQEVLVETNLPENSIIAIGNDESTDKPMALTKGHFIKVYPHTQNISPTALGVLNYILEVKGRARYTKSKLQIAINRLKGKIEALRNVFLLPEYILNIIVFSGLIWWNANFRTQVSSSEGGLSAEVILGGLFLVSFILSTAMVMTGTFETRAYRYVDWGKMQTRDWLGLSIRILALSGAVFLTILNLILLIIQFNIGLALYLVGLLTVFIVPALFRRIFNGDSKQILSAKVVNLIDDIFGPLTRKGLSFYHRVYGLLAFLGFVRTWGMSATAFKKEVGERINLEGVEVIRVALLGAATRHSIEEVVVALDEILKDGQRAELVVIDISDASSRRLEVLERCHPQIKVKFVKADIRSLPDEIGRFHIITGDLVFGFIKPSEIKETLERLREKLIPGGIMTLTASVASVPISVADWKSKEDAIENFSKAGFEDIKFVKLRNISSESLMGQNVYLISAIRPVSFEVRKGVTSHFVQHEDVSADVIVLSQGNSGYKTEEHHTLRQRYPELLQSDRISGGLRERLKHQWVYFNKAMQGERGYRYYVVTIKADMKNEVIEALSDMRGVVYPEDVDVYVVVEPEGEYTDNFSGFSNAVCKVIPMLEAKGIDIDNTHGLLIQLAGEGTRNKPETNSDGMAVKGLMMSASLYDYLTWTILQSYQVYNPERPGLLWRANDQIIGFTQPAIANQPEGFIAMGKRVSVSEIVNVKEVVNNCFIVVNPDGTMRHPIIEKPEVDDAVRIAEMQDGKAPILNFINHLDPKMLMAIARFSKTLNLAKRNINLHGLIIPLMAMETKREWDEFFKAEREKEGKRADGKSWVKGLTDDDREALWVFTQQVKSAGKFSYGYMGDGSVFVDTGTNLTRFKHFIETASLTDSTAAELQALQDIKPDKYGNVIYKSILPPDIKEKIEKGEIRNTWIFFSKLGRGTIVDGGSVIIFAEIDEGRIASGVLVTHVQAVGFLKRLARLPQRIWYVISNPVTRVGEWRIGTSPQDGRGKFRSQGLRPFLKRYQEGLPCWVNPWGSRGKSLKANLSSIWKMLIIFIKETKRLGLLMSGYLDASKGELVTDLATYENGQLRLRLRIDQNVKEEWGGVNFYTASNKLGPQSEGISLTNLNKVQDKAWTKLHKKQLNREIEKEENPPSPLNLRTLLEKLKAL